MVYEVNSKLKQAYFLMNRKKKRRSRRIRPIRLVKYFCSCDFAVLFR